MTDPSYLRKLIRAHKHFYDLKGVVDAWVARQPYRVTEEEQRKPLQRVWTITLVGPCPTMFRP